MAKKRSKKRKPKRLKKNRSLGCLIWITLALGVLVVFLFSRSQISHVMETTGLSETLSEKIGSMKVTEKTADGQTVLNEEKSVSSQIPETATPAPVKRPETPTPIQPETNTPPEIAEPTPIEPVDPTPQESQSQFRRAQLYFVQIQDDGSIALKQVFRPVFYQDAPLRATIDALLDGLVPDELNQQLMTVIPEGSRLKNVWIKNGVATLDFSEQFQFNTFGPQGYQAQLEQVIFTATEFPTVKSVQILIEGKRSPFLGADGPFIGGALDRTSFN